MKRPAHTADKPSAKPLALFCAGALVLAGAGLPLTSGTATLAYAKWRNPAQTLTDSAETYGKATLTRDSDGFFATLSASGKATFDTKIGLSDLEKLGISIEKGTKVKTNGAGSYRSPAKYGSTNGANFSYDKLVTITVDQAVFDQAAKLTYVNNNGATVNYDKRDTIQAVLYAIGKATQAPGFDGKTLYQVDVDYDGTIDLTNGIFVYGNTWLKLGADTVMKKEFQSGAVASDLADRKDAEARQIAYTNENLLRCGAGDLAGYAYSQCKNIIIEGGTWDANIAQYNRAKLGDKYQSSVATFVHMKNLVVRNATFLGANLGHHLELSGVRDVTVTGCRFSQDDGAYANEAIQIETLHGKGGTRESAPYDDTVSRDVVVYENQFDALARGLGNHANVLGHDSSRIYVYKNTFRGISSQAVLTCGCRTMRIADNKMENVGCGVDIRFTWEDGPLNFSVPHDEDWTYRELVSDGILNRNIVVTGNAIAATAHPEVDQVESSGTGIFVKGQTLAAEDLGSLKKAAGSYTLSGITLDGNAITSAIGMGVHLDQTSGASVDKNKISGVVAAGKRGDGIYAENSDTPSIAGNTIADAPRWGIRLVGASPRATIGSNKIKAPGTSPVIYASKLSLPQSISGNRFTVRSAYTMKLAGKKTRSIVLSKKSRSKLSGKALAKVTLKAYSGTKKIGAAKTDAKGVFAFKFKKKLPRKALIELRYTDGSANAIRFDFTL